MFRMFILFCFMLLSASVCYAEPIGRYLQGMVGTLNGDKVWQVDDSTTGEPLVADLGDLLYGGGAIQSNFSDTAIEYGYESGGLVSFKNNTSYFVETVLLNRDQNVRLFHNIEQAKNWLLQGGRQY